MTIFEAQTKAARIAKEHGFEETDVARKLLLMHTEISEAAEEYRAGHPVDEVYFSGENKDKPEGLMVELADCVIRILSFAHGHSVDMESLIELKMKYNESRPPKHGKQF